MKKFVLITISFIIFLLYLLQWQSCVNLNDSFHISSSHVLINLDGDIHADPSSSLSFVRFFHNKVTAFATHLMSIYLRYWDITFLISFFSFFILISLSYFVMSHKSLIRSHLFWYSVLSIIFLSPLLEMFILFPLPQVIRIILTLLPLTLLHFYTLWHFTTKTSPRTVLILFSIASVLSIWWLLILPQNIKAFCS